MSKFITECSIGDPITSVAFSNSGQFLACGSLNENVYVWNTEQYKTLEDHTKLEGHTLGVCDLSFSNIGNKLAVSSLDSTVQIWNLECEEQEKPEKMTTKFSQDATIQGEPLETMKVIFDAEDDRVVTAGNQGMVSFYSIKDQSKLDKMSLKTSLKFASAIAQSPSGRYLAVGNTQGDIFIFDREDTDEEGFQAKPHVLQGCHSRIVRSLSFIYDSGFLISGGDDQVINLIDMNHKKVVQQYSGHKSNVNCVDSHPNALKFVSCSYDKMIKVWDLETKKVQANINYHQANIWAARFNNDGTLIASGSEDGSLVIHQLQ